MFNKWLISILVMLCFTTSCSKENIMDKVSIVTCKVRCNNPVAHVQVFTRNNPIIIGEWSVTFITKSYRTALRMTCLDDPLATMTCQCYINGKLVKTVSGYEEIICSYTIR